MEKKEGFNPDVEKESVEKQKVSSEESPESLESAEKERLDNTVVVTRHSALVEYLVDQGLIDESVEVKTHVKKEDVKGKHVIGVLPNHLASKARSLTEVPLNLPAEKRGQELTKEDIERHAGQLTTYQISESIMPLDVLTGMEALHEKYPLRNMPGNPTMDDIILSSHQKFREALEDDDPAIKRAAQWFKNADEKTQRRIMGV